MPENEQVDAWVNIYGLSREQANILWSKAVAYSEGSSESLVYALEMATLRLSNRKGYAAALEIFTRLGY